MPFEIEKLNKLEQMSILTSAITIYCGLLYLTDDMGEGMKIFLFILILLSNAVFFITWLFGILEAYALLVSEKKPKIAKRLCFCFVRTQRFRNFASSLGINTQLFDRQVVPAHSENSTIIESSE